MCGVQHSLHGTEHLDRRTMYVSYDMYMYGADFHAACVGEAALEALAQCASLGLGELEPDVIHREDGGSPHDGSGWTKVVAGPRRKHPQDMRQGSCPPPAPICLHHNPFHILANAPDLEPLPRCAQEDTTLHKRVGETKDRNDGGGRNKKQSRSKRKVRGQRRHRGRHARHRSTKPQPPPAGLANNKTIKISVYGPAHQTHTLRLRPNDPTADLKDALQGMGYDMGDPGVRAGGCLFLISLTQCYDSHFVPPTHTRVIIAGCSGHVA